MATKRHENTRQSRHERWFIQECRDIAGSPIIPDLFTYQVIVVEPAHRYAVEAITILDSLLEDKSIENQVKCRDLFRRLADRFGKVCAEDYRLESLFGLLRGLEPTLWQPDWLQKAEWANVEPWARRIPLPEYDRLSHKDGFRCKMIRETFDLENVTWVDLSDGDHWQDVVISLGAVRTLVSCFKNVHMEVLRDHALLNPEQLLQAFRDSESLLYLAFTGGWMKSLRGRVNFEPPSAPAGLDRIVFSDGYRNCTWGSEDFPPFSDRAAKAVEAILAATEKGEGCSPRDVREAAGVHCNDTRDIFKMTDNKRHPAWGKMIARSGSGPRCRYWIVGPPEK